MPPLAIAYKYNEAHIEAGPGFLLNAVAVEFLEKCPQRILKHHKAENDWDFHRNNLHVDDLRRDILENHQFDIFTSLDHLNYLSIDIGNVLKNCGIFVLHSRRMVPHDSALITYST